MIPTVPVVAASGPQLAPAGVDLAHTVITADALQAQRAHAEYLRSVGAGFCFPVRQNQPGLFAALDALPWAQAPIAARDVDRGHAPGHHPHHPSPAHPRRPAVSARRASRPRV